MKRALLVLLVMGVPSVTCGQDRWSARGPCATRGYRETRLYQYSPYVQPYDTYEIRRLIEYRDLVRRVEAAERAQAEIERERRVQSEQIRRWIFGLDIPSWLR